MVLKFFEILETNFNKKKTYIQKIINPDNNFKFTFKKDNMENNIIELYENNKLVLKGEYQIIGMYNFITSIWYWASAIDFIDRELSLDAKKIQNFSKQLKDNF